MSERYCWGIACCNLLSNSSARHTRHTDHSHSFPGIAQLGVLLITQEDLIAECRASDPRLTPCESLQSR